MIEEEKEGCGIWRNGGGGGGGKIVMGEKRGKSWEEEKNWGKKIQVEVREGLREEGRKRWREERKEGGKREGKENRDK